MGWPISPGRNVFQRVCHRMCSWLCAPIGVSNDRDTGSTSASVAGGTGLHRASSDRGGPALGPKAVGNADAASYRHEDSRPATCDRNGDRGSRQNGSSVGENIRCNGDFKAAMKRLGEAQKKFDLEVERALANEPGG